MLLHLNDLKVNYELLRGLENWGSRDFYLLRNVWSEEMPSGNSPQTNHADIKPARRRPRVTAGFRLGGRRVDRQTHYSKNGAGPQDWPKLSLKTRQGQGEAGHALGLCPATRNHQRELQPAPGSPRGVNIEHRS